MKIESCGSKNPLEREGKSQNQRFTTGLATDYVLVDERSTADLLVWASKFAEGINYYKATHEIDGDWQDFIKSDISARIALIVVTDLDAFKNAYNNKVEEISEANSGHEVLLAELFVILKDGIQTIDNWLRQVLDHTSLWTEIRTIIRSRLRRHFKNLVEYAKGGVALFPSWGSADPISASIVGYSIDWIEQVDGLPATVDAWVASATANSAAYGGSTLIPDWVSEMVERLDFTFRGIYEGQYVIVGKANEYLEETLDEWGKHKPHMALFIAFLLIFKNAQDHINTFTERHLEFYYKEVLRLSENDATPDEVHVVFKLAKNLFSHRVEAGTLLSAGKDNTSVELNYALDEEIIVNTGLVDTISTIYIDGDDNGRVYCAPIANSVDGLGKPFSSSETPAWRPFGKTQKAVAEDEKTMQLADMGLAITSPILELGEGRRCITVQIHFDSDSWNAAALARQTALSDLTPAEQALDSLEVDFKVYLTTKKGWFEVTQEGSIPNPSITVGPASDPYYALAVNLGEEVLPIISYDSKLHGEGLETDYPVFKILINNERTLSPYAHLSLLRIKKVDIAVKVLGIRGLVVQNDMTVLAADKSFQPFGPRPLEGSNFYIGHREAFSKKLDSFQVNIEWAKRPSNFDMNYTLYQDANGALNTITANSFQAGISILDKRLWYELQASNTTVPVTLFAPTGIGGSVTGDPIGFNCQPVPSVQNTGLISIKVYDIQTHGNHTVDRDPELETFDALTHDIRKGFIRLKLGAQDFGHAQYNRIYARQAIKLGRGIETNDPDEIALAQAQGLPASTNTTGYYPAPFPYEPYTPEIKSISLDYASSVSVDLTKPVEDSAATDYEARIEKVYQYSPFGVEEVHPYNYDPGTLENDLDARAVGDPVIYLLPQYEKDTSLTANPKPHRGTLYIGLSGMNLSESNSLSLLFQVMESSASPDVDKPDITWAYREEGKWVSFGTAGLGTDSTNGLVTSGLMKFSLSEDATSSHSILPNGLHWLRGTVVENAEGLADVVAVFAQAAKATFSYNGNDPNHLAQALEAEKVAKLKIKEAEIKSVTQPYASFNGAMVEADESFYTRVSERLRHKDRAITMWDYETLVLQKFPSVYRVKCINHTSATAQIHPGHVYVVVVSNLVNKNAVDPLQPRISVNTLEEIATFLQAKNSPFVKLLVKNPDYEEVKVEFKVQFTDNILDTGFYLQQLNDDIIQHLTPWAYDSGADISFEGRLHGSVILDFVEELPYVDFLTDFKMYHFPDPDDPSTMVEVTEAVASTPMSILVSAASHDITLYTSTTCDG
jgi:hypothetical protein